jgi:hypothetical protein
MSKFGPNSGRDLVGLDALTTWKITITEVAPAHQNAETKKFAALRGARIPANAN